MADSGCVAKSKFTFFTVLAWLPVTALTVNLLVRPSFEGDSIVLVRDIFGIRSCLGRGAFIGCTAGGQFPLYQVLPGLLVASLGVSFSGVARFLAYLSAAAYAAMLMVVHRTLRGKSTSIAGLAVLVLASGYIIRYANSTFGEMLAAFVILCTVAAALCDKSLWIVLPLAFYSGLTKETAFPFVFLITALGWLCADRLNLKKVGSLALTCAAAFACNLLFNYFRFGTFINLSYRGQLKTMNDAVTQMLYFPGLWLSARGGILLFWPSIALVIGIIAWSTRRNALGRRLPLYGVGAILALLTLFFSKIPFTFGWYCWGARFYVPWLPASILILLLSYSSELRRALGKIPVPLLGLVALATLPQYQVMLRHQWVNIVIESDPCPPGRSPHACTAYLLWPRHWAWADMLLPSGHPLEWLGALLFSLILFYGLLRVSARATDEVQPG